MSAHGVTVVGVRSHARPSALLLALLACSSATGPRGLPGPDGTFLTTVVHETQLRVGDTVSVDLIISNTTSQLLTLNFPSPVPTLAIWDASGDAVSVQYASLGAIAVVIVEPHESYTAPTVLSTGTAFNDEEVLATLTPGVYSVAACMGSSCGQP